MSSTSTHLEREPLIKRMKHTSNNTLKQNASAEQYNVFAVFRTGYVYSTVQTTSTTTTSMVDAVIHLNM